MIGKIQNYLQIIRENLQENAVTLLRLAIGWVFLSSGLGKLAENGLEYSYASKYLTEALPLTTPEIAFGFADILQIPGLYSSKQGLWL